MLPPGLSVSRRRLLALTGGAVAAGALGAPAGAAAAPGGFPWLEPADDPVADAYHALLQVHTRWVEDQWDAALGAYSAADFRFAVVLGNAVLITSGRYDPALTGIDRETLKARTLATIKRYAATNRLAGGTEWGRQLFWDSTFELYFVLAARLLWADLDDPTRASVQAIATGQAAYAYGLGTGDDPLSGGWSPNGRAGGWVGDTKLEEMGVYAQAIAPALAWGSDNPALRERFLFWATNASSLPPADRANPTIVDGRPIKDRAVGHNLHDTFIVENHGSASPHYQAELWRTAGRAAIHFLAAGKPLPQTLTHQPNGEQLWATLRLLASDAGEPVMPMTADRYHLYGRDVLPLAFLAQVQGDPHAARAETDLAARLMPYLQYDPQYRLTKFSGEDKYEPEARAELAIAYLFHRRRRTPVRPVSPEVFFAAASGTRAFGEDVGMTVQQSPTAFAAAVTRKEFARFLWQPGHDNWLVDTRGPGFLPADLRIERRWTTAYRKDRHGVDATATVLAANGGFAGFATLPTGSVVYASTGIGPDEGGLTLFNLRMAGIAGLDGSRTFTGELGAVELRPQNDGGTDEISFPPRQARFVRMLARRAATIYGYSMWTFAVLDLAGADLAQGAGATASSAEPAFPASSATDGNPTTRWAVAHEERGRADSWLAVDLRMAVPIAGVRLQWETAYATGYVIQTSLDAVTWTDAAEVPGRRPLAGRWVDIDGRAGLVVHGADRPITVSPTGVVAAAGAPVPVLIEGFAGDGTDLAKAAARRMPTAPAGLRVSDTDGYLTVFNLTSKAVTAAKIGLVSTTRLYRGTQVATHHGLRWTVTLAAGTARVEPPRFAVHGPVPAGTRFEVTDSHHLTITAPARHRVAVTVRAGSWSSTVRVPAGRSRSLTVPGSPVTPTSDLARGRTTFPTSPLPPGMTPPGRAVDGDPRTMWRPGPGGRMVVDLGGAYRVKTVRLRWTRGARRPVRLESSSGGLIYAQVARVPHPDRVTSIEVGKTVRYLAVAVTGWRPGDAELIDFAVE
jgi:hypothetical protein